MRTPAAALLALVPLVALAAFAATGTPPAPDPNVSPLPALVRFAESAQIPLDAVETPIETREVRPGDSVTALVTLFQRAAYRQWLLQLTTVELNAEERNRPPMRPFVIHSNTGATLQFDSARLALTLRLVGPVSNEATAKPVTPAEKQARAIVNEEFLALGFDRAAAAALRLVEAAKADPTHQLKFSIGRKPFPADVVAKGRAEADALGLTTEDERALAAVSPALQAFFDVTQKTPGLKDILAEMLDKTSLAWSALRRGGRLEPSFSVDSSGISPIDAARWGTNLPPTYRYPVLVSLNDKPALMLQLVVTAARPPLVASAGVIGIAVSAPRDNDRGLVIRVLAAHRASPPTPPVVP